MKAVLGHMKIVNKRFLLALIVMQTIGGIVAAQEVLHPMIIANIVYMDTSIPFEDYAFMVKGDINIMNIDGKSGNFSGPYNYRIIMIPKGLHLFTFFYYQPITSWFDFEAGKYYYINADLESKFLKKEKIIYSLDELTDSSRLEKAKHEIELAKEYFNWTLSNNKMMEGTYQTQDGQQQILFSGNHFEYNHKKNKTNYKGIYFFNENNMILLVQNRNQKILNSSNCSLITYKLEGNLLSIITNQGYFKGKQGGKPYFIIGEYYKN